MEVACSCHCKLVFNRHCEGRAFNSEQNILFIIDDEKFAQYPSTPLWLPSPREPHLCDFRTNVTR
jgi:hypothetical protein